MGPKRKGWKLVATGWILGEALIFTSGFLLHAMERPDNEVWLQTVGWATLLGYVTCLLVAATGILSLCKAWPRPVRMIVVVLAVWAQMGTIALTMAIMEILARKFFSIHAAVSCGELTFC